MIMMIMIMTVMMVERSPGEELISRLLFSPLTPQPEMIHRSKVLHDEMQILFPVLLLRDEKHQCHLVLVIIITLFLIFGVLNEGISKDVLLRIFSR